jgi:hypothetical protein
VRATVLCMPKVVLKRFGVRAVALLAYCLDLIMDNLFQGCFQ